MANPSLPAKECESLTKAFSGLGGLGVDERSLLSALGQWRHPEQLRQFRKGCPRFFTVDGRGHHYNFERWEDNLIRLLKYEFARFKELVVLWAMHPWERDARWAHLVLHKARPFTILVEISCSRSSEELLGARRAYQALYHRSLEEDVADHVKENHSTLLIGLVSAYRYEGSRVNEETARSEAKILGNAIKTTGAKKAVENEDVIRILATRSKPHLRVTFRHYKEMFGKSLVEDLSNELCLQGAAQCLDSPPTYFSKVINESFKDGADITAKEALTRVVVARADVDMKEIKGEYHKQFGAKLEDVIEKSTHGNYRDALLSLVGMQK